MEAVPDFGCSYADLVCVAYRDGRVSVVTRDVSEGRKPVVFSEDEFEQGGATTELVARYIYVLADDAAPLTLTPELASGLSEVIRLADLIGGVGAIVKFDCMVTVIPPSYYTQVPGRDSWRRFWRFIVEPVPSYGRQNDDSPAQGEADRRTL